MAYIGHRCTTPECGHRIDAHKATREGPRGECEQNTTGPHRCPCNEGVPGPSLLLPSFNSGTGAPVETITLPGVRVCEGIGIGKACGCDDCRALHAQLTS